MALSDDDIILQNRWWTDPGWRAKDPHLALLDRQPMRLPAKLVADLDIRDPGVHVLRGSRQVGKTTDLKLIVERAIREGFPPRAVVYLTLDLLEGQEHAELARTVRRAKALAHAAEPALLLLDEVTLVERWQTAIKALWDEGAIRGDVVVCTGSSAIDLQRAAVDRLPGRRGAGADHLVLPQTFAAFARSLDPSVPESPRLTVTGLVADEGREILQSAQLYGAALGDALELHLRFGGLPAAVAEAVAGNPEPSERTKRVLYDSLLRELQKKGASVAAAHALLERIARSLGSKVSWSRMAREMDVPLGGGKRGRPSHHTVRDYIEFLASGYFILIAYFWRTGSQSSSLSNDKKILFADPLLHSIAIDRTPGLRRNLPALVENAIGVALYLRYEPGDRLPETFVSPERLHVWQTAKGGEIDFACGPRRALDVVEVKYGGHVDLRTAAAIAKGHRERPIVVATRDELLFRDQYSLVPAALLLWALG